MTGQSNATEPATTCLSEDEVLAFAGGQLSETRRDAAHQHFDQCDVCQELLSEAVHALATAPTAAFEPDEPVAWSTTFRSGTLVGRRYEVRRFIARGGMGEVYEAFDHELLERVALKTVTSTSGDNPTAVRRLKAEVQLARRVSHPNVCRIYDFGTHATASTGAQTCFFTMEFADGETLGQRLRKAGALTIDEASALARAMLLGLRAAHDAGVLHRDFKSDNVMLRRDGSRLSPLILDFGLARAFDRPIEQSSSTNHGFVGTFAYVAPEQLEGNPYSTASDIYSFGIVWFEMLTGELPFKARSSPAMTTLDRLTKPVPPPSSINPRVPAALDAIVLSCLTRAPGARLQTASAVLERLDALDSGAHRLPRKRPSAGLIAALGLIGVAGYLALSPRKEAPATASAGPTHATPGAPPPKAISEAPVAIEQVPGPAPPPPPAPKAETRPSALTPAPKVKPSESKPAQPAAAALRRQEQPAAAALGPQPQPTSAGWENPFGDDG